MAAKDESLDDINDEDPDAGSRLRRHAERKDREASEASTKLAVLERENAALKAGVDVSTRKGQAWLNSYDGDLSDVEAMRQDAQDFDQSLVGGSTTGATTTPGEQAGTGEAVAPGATGEVVEDTGFAQRQALADGAEPSEAAKEDVQQGALARAKEGMRQGATFEEAGGSFISELAKGVNAGTVQPLPASGQRRGPA